MINATTTCQYLSPKLYDGADPGSYEDIWNFASSSCATIQDTAPDIYNGFTYGEIVGTTFLFLIFMVLVYSFYWNSTHKRYITK